MVKRPFLQYKYLDVRYASKVGFVTYCKNFTIVSICILKKTATAVAHCKQGNGLIKVNGFPLHLVEPAPLRYKVSHLLYLCWCGILYEICDLLDL